jgi:predicted ferric reductase
MLAIWISTQLRTRIGYAWWRRLHTLTFAIYLLSTLHGLGTGTDSRHLWALALYAGSLLLIGALLVRRLLTPIGARGQAHPRLAALTAATLASVVVWACAGPAHAALAAVVGHAL